MKKWLLVVAAALVLSACANKDVYFNGAEGSHSGIKFDKNTRHWGMNPYSAVGFSPIFIHKI